MPFFEPTDNARIVDESKIDDFRKIIFYSQSIETRTLSRLNFLAPCLNYDYFALIILVHEFLQ